MTKHTTLNLIWINIKVFVSLLFFLNLFAGGVLYVIDKSHGILTDNRKNLPNYEKNRDWANSIFEDYHKTRTQYEPFIEWSRLPYSGKTTHVGEDGDRITPDSFPTVKKEYTAHFFGGSTMWGTGVDDGTTIPAFFAKNFPNVRVKNHGEKAYTSRQNLARLINLYASGERMDLVVFYDGANDVYHQCIRFVEKIPAHARTNFLRKAATDENSHGLTKYIKGIFIDNLSLLITKILQTPYFRPQNEDCFVFDCPCNDNKKTEIASNLLANWQIAHDIVTVNGGKFIGILQPIIFEGHPKTDHLSEYIKNKPGMKKSFKHTYPEIKTRLKTLHKNWLFDLTHLFDVNEYLYIDFCHVSASGNQYVADTLSKIVINKGIFSKPDSIPTSK